MFGDISQDVSEVALKRGTCFTSQNIHTKVTFLNLHAIHERVRNQKLNFSVAAQELEDLVKIGSAVLEIARAKNNNKCVSKGPFIATQLNSTRRRVQLSCVGEVSIATQLNSTRLTCFALIGCTLQLGQLHCRSPATVELRR